jgi:hypothetical protein
LTTEIIKLQIGSSALEDQSSAAFNYFMHRHRERGRERETHRGRGREGEREREQLSPQPWRGREALLISLTDREDFMIFSEIGSRV